MIRLLYMVLLMIGTISFSGQTATNKQIPEPARYSSHLNQECMDRVDPLNPSPLTWTDYNMLVVDCMD